MTKRGQKEGSEPSTFRVGDSDRFALKEIGEETLSQVLGVMLRTSATAGESINGAPIALAQLFERRPTAVRIVPTRHQHDGPLGGVKPMAQSFNARALPLHGG